MRLRAACLRELQRPGATWKALYLPGAALRGQSFMKFQDRLGLVGPSEGRLCRVDATGEVRKISLLALAGCLLALEGLSIGKVILVVANLLKCRAGRATE